MLHIGDLIVAPIQVLDIALMDLFAMLTQSYFSACNLPAPLIFQALPDASLKISYISQSTADPPSQVPTTAFLDLGITATNTVPAKQVLEFVRAHVREGVDLLTICTGIFVAGHAGVLNGKSANGPRGLQNVLSKKFSEVKWVDMRYVRNEKIWTSGGITNGMNIVGVYIRTRWPGPLSEPVLAMADVEPRPQEYEQGEVAFTGWFVFVIFKAWLRELTGRKKIE